MNVHTRGHDGNGRTRTQNNTHESVGVKRWVYCVDNDSGGLVRLAKRSLDSSWKRGAKGWVNFAHLGKRGAKGWVNFAHLGKRGE